MNQAIHSRYFVEESHTALIASMSARSTGRQTLIQAYDHCNSVYGGEFLLHASPKTFLIRGVVLEFVRHGHSILKSAEAKSNSLESLEGLLQEIGLETVRPTKA
ncbi:hypothetical protein EXS73_00840 [Candidatus Pacearchaeota archaeon]|nr:hypothetical protein [Candidatus Pacearchaeota archaeon]